MAGAAKRHFCAGARRRPHHRVEESHRSEHRMWYAVRFLDPHALWIAIGGLFLITAWIRPLLARWLYALLFGGACLVNAWTATFHPDAYLGYAPLAMLDVYRDLVGALSAFQVGVLVMAVAVCQGFAAFGLAIGGPLARVALVGAAIFLVAIAPLGAGAAFPSTLLMALGALLLLRHRGHALEGGVIERTASAACAAAESPTRGWSRRRTG